MSLPSHRTRLRWQVYGCGEPGSGVASVRRQGRLLDADLTGPKFPTCCASTPASRRTPASPSSRSTIHAASLGSCLSADASRLARANESATGVRQWMHAGVVRGRRAGYLVVTCRRARATPMSRRRGSADCRRRPQRHDSRIGVCWDANEGRGDVEKLNVPVSGWSRT